MIARTDRRLAERQAEVKAEWDAFYRKMERGADGYTLTRQEYRALYLAQNGRCYICAKAKGKHPDDPNGRGGRRLAVDHDHLRRGRSAVRGLLCSGSTSANTCNRLIARYSVEALERAAEYMRQPPAWRVLAVRDAGEKTGQPLQDWQLPVLGAPIKPRGQGMRAAHVVHDEAHALSHAEWADAVARARKRGAES